MGLGRELGFAAFCGGLFHRMHLSLYGGGSITAKTFAPPVLKAWPDAMASPEQRRPMLAAWDGYGAWRGKGTRRFRKLFRQREAAHLAAQERIRNAVPLRIRRVVHS